VSIFKSNRQKQLFLYTFMLLFLIASTTTIIYYLNYPFVETNIDTGGYTAAYKQLITTGNPVNDFRMPTYSFFFFIVYAFAGQNNLFAVGITQGVLFVAVALEIYVIAFLLFRATWVAFAVGLLVGTNYVLLSYCKPIMTEGLSMWFLASIFLCAILFIRSGRLLFFWLSSFFLLLLMFTRPEWILFPFLLYGYMILITRKRLRPRALYPKVAVMLLLIYSLTGAYIYRNAQLNGVIGLSTVDNMNLIGKVVQYRMQNDIPQHATASDKKLSSEYSWFINHGITSPYQIGDRDHTLDKNDAAVPAHWAEQIIIHHPLRFIRYSIPYFFTSLYHYVAATISQPWINGPYQSFINTLLSTDQSLYSCNILFPFCALVWLGLLLYKKTRKDFGVQMMGLAVVTVIYAVIVTTMGGYTEADYMRVHIVFDPLITLVIWGSIAFGVYSVIRRIGDRDEQQKEESLQAIPQPVADTL
jgi:hypothetical protein